MPARDLVAGVALLAVVAYGVLAGADFGGGVLDALARGPRKAEQREAIARAMGPVWEANHVWLIFAVVVLFTAFPVGYAALSVGLWAPFHLALVGISLRGAAFVFRGYGVLDAEGRRRWGTVFGVASAMTPVILGMALGAVSSGRLRVVNGEVRPDGVVWLTPLTVSMGALALAICAYTAAVFLTNETEGALREDFRRRALESGTVTVALSAITLPVTASEAPHLWEGLTHGRALPVLIAGTIAALASGLLLRWRRWRAARAASVAQVALVLSGWGLAQHPYLIFPDVTLAQAAAPEATLRFLLVAVPCGMLALLPSLWLLFRVFKRGAAERPAGE